MFPRLGWGPLTLATHRLVPADGPPGARLAASAGEGEVAWFAPVFPVAAPLGEAHREAGLEPVLWWWGWGVLGMFKGGTGVHRCASACAMMSLIPYPVPHAPG